MIARNDDEATRGGRRPRGGDQLQAEAAKSVMKGVRMRDRRLRAAELTRSSRVLLALGFRTDRVAPAWMNARACSNAHAQRGNALARKLAPFRTSR